MNRCVAQAVHKERVVGKISLEGARLINFDRSAPALLCALRKSRFPIFSDDHSNEWRDGGVAAENKSTAFTEDSSPKTDYSLFDLEGCIFDAAVAFGALLVRDARR
jgi:hypothetical protein